MTEEQKKEELKFPLSFTKCPICGSTRRVGETVVKQGQEKGKIGPDAKPFLFMQQTLVMDPRKPTLTCPIIISFYDVCAEPNCGSVYCVHAELVQGRPQMTQPLWFPQNNPRTS